MSIGNSRVWTWGFKRYLKRFILSTLCIVGIFPLFGQEGDKKEAKRFAPSPSLARWGEVPAWEGTFRAVWHALEVRDSYSVGGDARRTEDIEVNGTVLLDKQTNLGEPATTGSGGQRASIWHGRAAASVRKKVLDIDREKDGRVFRSEEGSGAGIAEADCDLQIDAPRGRFVLYVRSLPIDMRYTDWYDGRSHPRVGRESVALTGTPMNGGPGLGSGSLPVSGLLLNQTAKISYTPPPPWTCDCVYTETYSYSLHPVGEPLEVVLVVKPYDYDSWLPESARSESIAGNEIRIDAELQGPDGGVAKVKARKIIFELSDTSREPGVCMNWPPKNALPEKEPYDLRFLTQKNPKMETSDEEGQKISTVEGKYHKASAVLSCFDWGAWSTLKVTAELENGQSVTGHLKSKSGPTEILLPKRQTGSHIADFWKGSSDPADNDDGETSPVGDGFAGDGLGLYEEYRGFCVELAKSWHERTSPTVKDYFVRDELRIGTDKAFKHFSKISGFAVHRIPADAHENRVINFNFSAETEPLRRFDKKHGQHLVILGPPNAEQRPEDLRQTGTEGVTICQPSHGNVTPKDVDHIVIYRTPGRGRGDFTGTVMAGPDGRLVDNGSVDLYLFTIVHEMMHSVNVPEHGADPRLVEWNASEDGRGVIEGTLGPRTDGSMEVISTRPVIPFVEGRREVPFSEFMSVLPVVMLSVASQGGAYSGDQGCIMRYHNAGAVEPADNSRNERVWLVVAPKEALGMGLCDQKTGTGVNAPPTSRYGDATNGACAKRLRVSDVEEP